MTTHQGNLMNNLITDLDTKAKAVVNGRGPTLSTTEQNELYAKTLVELTVAECSDYILRMSPMLEQLGPRDYASVIKVHFGMRG
jgi:hypothetical protein